MIHKLNSPLFKISDIKIINKYKMHSFVKASRKWWGP